MLNPLLIESVYLCCARTSHDSRIGSTSSTNSTNYSMPGSSAKKAIIDSNLRRVRDTIENAIASQKMTRDEAVKTSKILCAITQTYANLDLNEAVIPDRHTSKSSTVVESELHTIDEHENGGTNRGVTLDDNSYLLGETMSIKLKKSKPHLFVICSLCSAAIVIEYRGSSLPEFTSGYVHLPRNGITYATCHPCLRSNAKRNGGTNLYDWTRKDRILNGDLELDTVDCSNLGGLVDEFVSGGVNLIMHSNKPSYLTQRLIKASITNESKIATVNADLIEMWYGDPTFTEYTNGSFLQP